MQEAFYNPLGDLTVTDSHRNFATRMNLPTYPEKIVKLKAENARLITVFGIGRMFHIAFWEPQFAVKFSSEAEWKSQLYRLGAEIHHLTIELINNTSPIIDCGVRYIDIMQWFTNSKILSVSGISTATEIDIPHGK